MKATCIFWDARNTAKADLPDEMELPDGIENVEDAAEWLSDQTGYCVEGFLMEEI